MKNVPMKKFMIRVMRGLISLPRERWRSSSRFSIYHRATLLALTTLLSLGSLIVTSPQAAEAYAANPGPGKTCRWYRIRPGDTLGRISRLHGINVGVLARANRIANANLILSGQNLCIPIPAIGQRTTGRLASGLLPNGRVRWYAYNALEWSTRSQVSTLLRQAAARRGLPANLVLAIAWQESGWNHHVIARDGGIGAMQIMPYTAEGLNKQVRRRYDPYKLRDNIELGTIYLQSLWRGFKGNQTKVISAYNQGGWNVVHRGIFNWPYVRSVQALMRRY